MSRVEFAVSFVIHSLKIAALCVAYNYKEFVRNYQDRKDPWPQDRVLRFERSILKFLDDNPGSTVEELVTGLAYNWSTRVALHKALVKLEQGGWITADPVRSKIPMYKEERERYKKGTSRLFLTFAGYGSMKRLA